MNEKQKLIYMKQRREKVMGSAIVDLEMERIGKDYVACPCLRLRHPNGDEFTVKSFNGHLHITQALWGG